MAKPSDRAVNELMEDIKWVVSSRYVEDPEPFSRPFYTLASGDEPSFAFASLNRRDRLELLADLVSWRKHGNQGISADEQRVIIANVLDGKPPERWLEGALDKEVQRNAIQNILRDDPPERLVSDRDVQRQAFQELLRNEAPQPSMARKEGRDLDGFDRAVANLRRHFHDHSLGKNWQDLSAETKVVYLATFAAVHDAPFDRFAKAARHVVGYTSQEDLTPDDWWHLRRIYKGAMESRALGKEVGDTAAEFREVKSPDRSRDIAF